MINSPCKADGNDLKNEVLRWGKRLPQLLIEVLNLLTLQGRSMRSKFIPYYLLSVQLKR